MSNLSDIARRLSRGLTGSEDLTDRKTVYTFDLTIVSLPDINELRRFIFREHQTVAIYELEVNKNTSSTHDNIYLGLFSYLLIDDSEWNGETVEFRGQEYLGSFSIVASGEPGRKTPMITPADFVTNESANGLRIVSDKRAPIVWLRDNEEIDMVAYVKRARSGDHASFFPHTRAYIVPPSEESEEVKFVVEKRYSQTPDIVETALNNMPLFAEKEERKE